jgi:hypothetical protein
MNLQTLGTAQNSANALDAAGVLLRDLIDYAGLFPPAALPMSQSVANYEEYLRSEWQWVLGRFVVPVARLGEFEAAFAALLPSVLEPGAASWRLSALLGADVSADITHIREFNQRMASASSGRRAVVESVEVKATNAAEIARFSKIIPAELAAYFEIPLSDLGECITAIAACGRRANIRAKIRTGGETADKFPAPESVIEFIRQCAAAHVPFKATAGLHHPLRSVHRFTYQSDSPSGIMHGFLNVFLAAAFLRAGIDPALAVEMLEEQSVQAFHFDLDGVGWRQHRIGHQELAAARRDFAISFGSCSFTEPVDDLRSLHLL